MVKNDIKLLEQLLNNSKRILIVTHTRPDPDAVSSTVLLHTLLRDNYPDKEITSNIEGEITSHYSFLKNLEIVGTGMAIQALETFKPDLVFLVDGMNWKRVSITDGPALKNQISTNKIKLVIIDHHEEVDIDECDLYMNYGEASTSESIYTHLIKALNLKPYEGYETAVITGIVTDTGSFKNKVKHPRQTFSVAADMVEAGVDIEKILNALSRIDEVGMRIYTEMTNNFVCTDDYNYTYISQKFFKDNKKDLNPALVDAVYHYFIDSRLRSSGKAVWGFIVFYEYGRQDENGEEELKRYKGSMRAEAGIDTTVFSRQFGGGGHKGASAFTLMAKSDQEAIQMVIDVIEKHRSEAYGN
ncbi:DHH family phosphoesterase [bacterium]|nr:DHH family phosphoesterase [bacterium]